MLWSWTMMMTTTMGRWWRYNRELHVKSIFASPEDYGFLGTSCPTRLGEVEGGRGDKFIATH